MNVRKLRVLVADDHPIMRKGVIYLLQGSLGIDVCDEAGSVADCLATLERAPVDVLVVDCHMKDGSGTDVLVKVQEKWPDVQVIILSTHNQPECVMRALRLGASGYVSKDAEPTEIMTAVYEVARGNTYVSRSPNAQLLSRLKGGGGELTSGPGNPDALTRREREVLALVAEGNSTSRIARRLGVSVKTVEAHREHIKNKLALHSANELVRTAVRWQIEGLL